MLPARIVPVAAKVGRVDGDDHDVHRPWPDVVVAAGTQVGLEGLVGLYPAHLYGFRAHRTRSRVTPRATARKT